MKKQKRKDGILALLLPVLVALVMLGFSTALSNLQQGQSDEGKRQLEDALHRAAVACYAAEGIYPPDLAYMQTYYGIQIDQARYTVMYDAFASNLMPDITVLENES